MKKTLKFCLSNILIFFCAFRLEAFTWDDFLNILPSYLTNQSSNTVSDPFATTWETPVDISPNYLINETPKIASDPNGNAMAVWTADTGIGYTQIFAIHYTFGRGWDASPTPLSLTESNASVPFVSMDNSGNAMAIWQQSNEKNFDMKIAFYTQMNNTWSSPLNVSPSGESAITPEFCFDGSGNGIAIWKNNTTNKIQAIHYTQLTNTWSAIHDISEVVIPYVPHLALNSTGKAIVVWTVDTGLETMIQANAYDGSNWGVPATISDTTLNANQPSIGIDQAGNGIAIWIISETAQVVSSKYNQSLAVWSSFIPVTQTILRNSEPSIAVVPATGDAIAIWRQFDMQQWALAATFNFATSSWSSPSIISDLWQNVDDLKVLVDSQGNGIALWKFYNYNKSKVIIGTAPYDFRLQSWSRYHEHTSSGKADEPYAFINTAAPTFHIFTIWKFTKDNTNYVVQAVIGSYTSSFYHADPAAPRSCLSV